MRPRRPLYVMAKPPPDVAEHIVGLPRNDPARGPDLLHVTLLSLFDLHHAPSGWLESVIAALDTFEGSSFPLRFDRIEERRAVTLRTRDPLSEARMQQAALIGWLVERRAPCMLGTTPVPHLTINYRGDGQGNQAMAPIGWTVGEILLIESVVGRATHVEHGRWPLRAKDAECPI